MLNSILLDTPVFLSKKFVTQIFRTGVDKLKKVEKYWTRWVWEENKFYTTETSPTIPIKRPLGFHKE